MPAETDFAPPSGLAQLAPGVEVTATCPSATGARRALTVRRLARRPHLYRLRNVLSAAECDRLVAAAVASARRTHHAQTGVGEDHSPMLLGTVARP